MSQPHWLKRRKKELQNIEVIGSSSSFSSLSSFSSSSSLSSLSLSFHVIVVVIVVVVLVVVLVVVVVLVIVVVLVVVVVLRHMFVVWANMRMEKNQKFFSRPPPRSNRQISSGNFFTLSLSNDSWMVLCLSPWLTTSVTRHWSRKKPNFSTVAQKVSTSI